MKKFTITFAATGGVEIEAETEEEAIAQFDKMSDSDLMEELNQNGIEMTEIFCRGDIKMMHLYRISADGGNTWTEQWMTEEEAREEEKNYICERIKY